MQQTLFKQTPYGLVPNHDPYGHHKSRINQTKAEHYEAHISSEKGKRQVDLVFDALISHPDSTDRELKAIIEGWGYRIEISAIPARRADIEKFFSDWRVIASGKRECSVTGTQKTTWKLVKKGSAPSVTTGRMF